MIVFRKFLFPILLAVLIAFAWYTPGQAAGTLKVVVGETFTLKDGETLDEDLVVIGGNAVLEEGSQVNGNIVVLGGSLEVSGLVSGNIMATGGYVRLQESAVIHGDVSAAGADIDKDVKAQVDGEVNSTVDGPFNLTIPGPGSFPAARIAFNPIWRAVSFLAQILVLSALAVLVAMFFPASLGRVEQAAFSQPLISGGLGFFTLLVAPVLAVLMAITLILIPVSLISILLIALLVVFGWIALGTEVGRRFGLAIHQEWTPPLAAGVGTFALTLVIGSLSFIQCLGWIFPLLAICLGLGAVLLTRFGTRVYPEVLPVSIVTPEPPAGNPQ